MSSRDEEYVILIQKMNEVDVRRKIRLQLIIGWGMMIGPVLIMIAIGILNEYGFLDFKVNMIVPVLVILCFGVHAVEQARTIKLLRVACGLRSR